MIEKVGDIPIDFQMEDEIVTGTEKGIVIEGEGVKGAGERRPARRG